jgi:hypothetical protein
MTMKYAEHRRARAHQRLGSGTATGAAASTGWFLLLGSGW